LCNVVVVLASEGVEKISLRDFFRIVDSLVEMYPGLRVDKTRDNFSDQCRLYKFMKWKGEYVLVFPWLIPISYVGYAMDNLYVRHGLYDTLRSLISEIRNDPNSSVNWHKKDVICCRTAIDEILKKHKCRIVSIDGECKICPD
jgi:hypothetical protein